MQNLEQAIRERAYHLWVAAGQPDGNADHHWLTAQREVLSVASGAHAVDAAQGKSANKVRAPRSTKAKRAAA